MKTLRIAVVAFPTHGGSGVVGFESARLLSERGHRVSFVSSDLPLRASNSTGLELCLVERIKHPLFSPGAYAWSLSSCLLDLHFREPLDVIHVHYAVPHAVSSALVRQTLASESAPALVAHLHGTDVTQYTSQPSQRELTRWALEQHDALVVPSRALKGEAAERFGFPAERFQVFRNFVQLDTFAPGELGSGAPRLVHVSNLRPVKRGLDVVAVFERARATIPELELTVVGDGPDRAAMENYVSSAGLTSAVQFVGVDVDVASHLKSASVFLLPSELESFGLAALEAMACGVPVVGTEIGGLPEVVKHGEGGYLHAVGDIDAMAGSVVSLLRDRQLLENQRELSRKRAVHIGDPKPVLDQYEALYASLV
ncbi:MAG: N-acetyl-alpha-D-glucosaminyl L-malate synthase BshA [Myxococcota bacterium]